MFLVFPTSFLNLTSYLYTGLFVLARSINAVSGHALKVIFLVTVVFIVVLAAMQEGDFIEHRAAQMFLRVFLARVPTNANKLFQSKRTKR